jgi:hypothetical protein
MSHDSPAEPVRALDYFEDEGPASFQALRQLVLLAGAGSALMELVVCSAELLRGSPELLKAIRNGFPSFTEAFAVSVTGLLILFSAAAILSCVITIESSRARNFTIAIEAVVIFLAGSITVLQIWSYSTMFKGNLQRHVFATLSIERVGGLLQQSIIPMLVIVVFVRKDMRAPRLMAGTSENLQSP